jgi:hypothetical protein
MEVTAKHPTHTKTDAQTDTVVGTYTVDEAPRNSASRARQSDARTASWMMRLNPLKSGAGRSLLPHFTRAQRVAPLGRETRIRLRFAQLCATTMRIRRTPRGSVLCEAAVRVNAQTQNEANPLKKLNYNRY